MSTKKYDIYGIGNAIMDFQVDAEESDLLKFNLEKGGMSLIDESRLSDLLSYYYGREVKRSSGGSGANTIIALAQLGRSCAYGCIVGDDESGETYFKELHDLGVTLFNKPLNGAKTGHCVVMITPDAERTMSTCLGISSDFSSSHINENAIKNSQWIYVEGYLFSSEPGREAVKHAISIAKTAGTKIAVTLSDGFIVDCFRDTVTESISGADLVFANINEANKYTGETDYIESMRVLKKMSKNVVITLGEKGAIGSYNGKEAQVEATEVHAVDETGAGDMFAAGFLDSVIRGLPTEVALSNACMLAGKIVSQYGARLKVSDLGQILHQVNS